MADGCAHGRIQYVTARHNIVSKWKSGQKFKATHCTSTRLDDHAQQVSHPAPAQQALHRRQRVRPDPALAPQAPVPGRDELRLEYVLAQYALPDELVSLAEHVHLMIVARMPGKNGTVQ